MSPGAVADAAELTVARSEQVDRLAAIVEVRSVDDEVRQVAAGCDAGAFDASGLGVAACEWDLGGNRYGGEGESAAEACTEETLSAKERWR